MIPRQLKNQVVLLGILLTWSVGGVIGFVGYRQMVSAVRREAMARVENAVRVGQRVLETEFVHLDPDGPLPPGARLLRLPAESAPGDDPLAALIRKARVEGKAEGFALLPEGLSMAAVRRGSGGRFVAAVQSLRDANRLPDLIRDIVFGPDATARGSATITLFEGDVRIATNVTLADGRRAVGTRASPDVARRVLREAQVWNDRAFVVDRWMITCYQPLRAADGAVIGMLYAGLDEAPYVAERERNILLSVLAVLGLTLAVSAGGWVLGGRLARPLTQLTSAAAALARGERERIETSPRDPEEVRALAEAFNRMSDEIHAQTAALEASRQRAHKTLQDYLEVLGFVAHELKNPINGALTQLNLIDEGYVGKPPEAFGRPLSALRRSLEYGREIAQSFTNLSRAESEGFTPRLRPLEDFVREVLALAVGDCAAEAAQRQMPIRVEGGPVPTGCDPDLMRVVLDNLIGNAVKYGEKGSEILVAVAATPAALRVAVTNRGVGVAPERLPELFAKFHRIQDPQLRSRKGTGVGLYLVKRIVELHGGQVGVEGAYGQWIRFWFEIPQAAASAAALSGKNT
jgi:signal transduction histidine kinase